MATMVKKWIKGCATCQQMKVITHPTSPGLTPIKSNSTRPFQFVTCDFITGLPPSNGFDSIMVVVDHGLTKGVIYTPCMKNIDAIGTTQLFVEHVYKQFGLLGDILTDRGPQFISKKCFKNGTKLLK